MSCDYSFNLTSNTMSLEQDDDPVIVEKVVHLVMILLPHLKYVRILRALVL